MKQDDYSSSNRRKFLIGAGSVAAGTAALFGTAATTTFSLNDRAVSANVVTDSDGAVALTDEEQGDIINYTNDELEIDFTEGGAGGVNVGSVVDVGTVNDVSNDPAFTITNQTTDAVDLTFQFEAGEGYNAIDLGSQLSFYFKIDRNAPIEQLLHVRHSADVVQKGDVVEETLNDQLEAGEKVDVAFRVHADNDNSDVTENLSGVLNITATQG